jgi:hypothetical protein
MKNQLAELALQRRKILERIEAQRIEVTDISLHIKRSVAKFDIALSAVHFMSRHPALLAGGFAVFLTLWRYGITVLSSNIPFPVRFVINTILSTSRSLSQEHSDIDTKG